MLKHFVMMVPFFFSIWCCLVHCIVVLSSHHVLGNCMAEMLCLCCDCCTPVCVINIRVSLNFNLKLIKALLLLYVHFIFRQHLMFIRFVCQL